MPDQAPTAADAVVASFHPSRLRSIGKALLEIADFERQLGRMTPPEPMDQTFRGAGESLLRALTSLGYVLTVGTPESDRGRVLSAWASMMPTHPAPTWPEAQSWVYRIGVKDVERAVAITFAKVNLRGRQDPVRYWWGVCSGIERERSR